MKDKKVLIVDFDERSIEPLSQFLEEEGFDVLVARDGEEGLEMAKKERPQLVILEPMLPKLHGFELCGIITHDLEPKIPVIILTKFYREEQFKIESVRSFGASAFVSKPFKQPALRELIGTVLEETPEEKPEPELEQDKEEINGTAIPDAIPPETLKKLQEEVSPLNPEKPEIPGKKEVEVIEQDSLAKDLKETISEKKPAKPEVKKERDFGLELDAMLEDAFSDLGLVEPEKEDASVDGAGFLGGERSFPSNAAAVKSQASALEKEPALPELSVEDLLAPEPQKMEPHEDDVLSKINEIAQNTIDKQRADDSSFPAAEPKNSPEEILQKAEAVTETLEKELEDKVKEMSAREESRKGFLRFNKEPEAEEAAVEKAPEEKRAAEESVAEKVSEEKIEPELVAEAKPAAVVEARPAAASIEEEPVKTTEATDKPDLKDMVEKEGMFSGFGPDEDQEESSSGFVQNILAKFKKSPKKFIIPMAAVILVAAVGGMIMIPSISRDMPSEQASLSSPSTEQSLPAVVEKDDPVNSAVDPTQDPNGIDNQAEGAAEEQDPPASQPAAPPEEKPEPKPEQKPEPKSTPPPAPAVDDIAEAEVSSQLAGGMVPTQTQLDNEAPARKPAPKEEAGTAGGAGETDPGTAAANPLAAKPENEPAPAPVNNAPAKASVGDIVSIKQVDTEPELIQQELPRYPGAAKGRGITGQVLLNALISENGDVLQTVVIRKMDSPYGFNEAAERAVKLWKFRPAWKDGVRVKVWKVIPIQFKENMDE